MRRGSLQNAAEYALARVALAIVPGLSRRALLRLAHVLGALSYASSRHLRQVAMANLALVFPDRPARELRKLARQSFKTFALVMLDTFWLARRTRERLSELVRFDDSFSAIFTPGPLICLSAHLGNWEVLGMAITGKGEPLVSVATPLKNPRVDPLFNELRHGTGQILVPRQGAVRHLLKALRQGHKIALLLDQNTKPVEGGLFVDFFGRKAPVSSAAALLALRTKAPIIIGVCLPAPDGHYQTAPLIHIDTSGLPADQGEALQVLTQRIADGTAQAIRTYPGHWLWAYKRWKIRPEGESPGRYPFYTRAVRPADLATRGSPEE